MIPSPPIPGSLYADLIGKRFVAGGRGPEVFDCVGLVIELMRRRGLPFADYASTQEELHRQYLRGGGMLGPCRAVDFAAPGHLVLLRTEGGPAERHLGVMVDRFHMLHASEPARSVVLEHLYRTVWGRRVLGFYLLEPSLLPEPLALPEPQP